MTDQIPGSAQIRDRIVTIPNILSATRLLGVPFFLWLILVPHADTAAVILLAIAGATDWFDGKLARWLNQTSRVGELLDPMADRLYILAMIVAMLLRGLVPLWLVIALVSRDVLLLLLLPSLRRRGLNALPVHYLGKAATFCLLWAFPLILLGSGAESGWLLAVTINGWAIVLWGAALYWWAGFLYLVQWFDVLQTLPVTTARKNQVR